MELRIPVWQFVRIMVHLEGDSGRGKSKGESVYGDWLDAWTELDAHLTKLGKTNADGFADLMMEQEVLVYSHESPSHSQPSAPGRAAAHDRYRGAADEGRRAPRRRR